MTTKRSENRRMRRANLKATAAIAKTIAAQSSCGTCTACCTSLTVDVLLKPEGTPCKHLRTDRPGKSCARYETRPKTCEHFVCLWRIARLDESYRPDKVGIVLFPWHYGSLIGIMAMAETVEAANNAAEWIDALSRHFDCAVAVRVVGRDEWALIGSPEQRERALQEYNNRRRLRVLRER